MAIAGNVSLVTVTGTYVDFQGNSIAGQLIFRVPKTLRNAVADQILVPSSYVVTLNASGSFSVVLPATDDSDFHESFEYLVTESFAGGRTFSFSLPAGLLYSQMALQPYSSYVLDAYEDLGLSRDMSSLAPVPVVSPYVALAGQANYISLEQRVTAVEADVDSTAPTTGVILTLEYESLPTVSTTYTSLSSDVSTYTALAGGPLLATLAGVSAYVTLAEAQEAAAEASLVTAQILAAKYPHPFVFTGVE